MTVMSIAEFAKHLGFDRAYIRRLETAGRLVMTSERRVRAEESIARIAETADPARVDVVERHAAARKTAPKSAPEGKGAEEPVKPPVAPAEPAEGNSSYQHSRAVKERYAAMQAQLDFEKAAGKVVDIGDVQRAHRELGILLRQALERLPDQLAPELAAESDSGRVHALLQGEIEQVLRSISERSHSMAERLKAGQP